MIEIMHKGHAIKTWNANGLHKLGKSDISSALVVMKKYLSGMMTRDGCAEQQGYMKRQIKEENND